VTRAQLGVTVQTMSLDMADALGLKEARGVLVSDVSPGSAADKAGLKRGDVITSLNGQQVRDMNTLRNRVAAAGPGSTADVTIVRDGAEKQVKVTLEAADGRRASRRGGGGAAERRSPGTKQTGAR